MKCVNQKCFAFEGAYDMDTKTCDDCGKELEETNPAKESLTQFDNSYTEMYERGK